MDAFAAPWAATARHTNVANMVAGSIQPRELVANGNAQLPPAAIASFDAPQSADSTYMLAASAVAGVASAFYNQKTSKNKASQGLLAAAAGAHSQSTVTKISKGGAFVGASHEDVQVVGRCAKTGRCVAMKAGGDGAAGTKAAINGFGRIGRNVIRCWLGRDSKAFDLVAINVGSMSPATAAHLLKYDTVLGTLKADVSYTDTSLVIDGKSIALVTGRDPTKMPWKDLGVDIVIESTGAFNTLEGGSKHLEGGAKKVVLTAPGKNCPTYVVGVNEQDYNPATDSVISNASCTTNAMASVSKVLDEHFGVQYGVMTTTHAYTGDQKILDARHSDLRRARAGACNIVPTTTGAAKAVAEVLPQFKGKLNGIALRVPTPNVSVVDLVVKVEKTCTKEDVNAALKAAADGPMKGIINFETQPLVSCDFLQSDYSNSVDAELTMVMGGDLVKVILWYDNEWGYSQRVIDLTSIVARGGV